MSNSNNSHVVTSTTALAIIDGKAYRISQGKRYFNSICDALSGKDYEGALSLFLEREKDHQARSEGPVTDDRVHICETTGKVTLNGEEMPDYMTRRIKATLEAGKDVSGLCKYLEFLSKNTSSTIRERLSDFLDACDVGITDEGMLGLYKRVREDYLDCHSRTFDNSPGRVVSIPKEEVDDDHRRTCSRGLHVCSEGYLNSYTGSRIVYVLVNPADVVAIPYDYNNSKMRVCSYKVVSDVTDAFADDEGKFNGDTLSGDFVMYDLDEDEDYEVEWEADVEYLDRFGDTVDSASFFFSAPSFKDAIAQAIELGQEVACSNAFKQKHGWDDDYWGGWTAEVVSLQRV